MSASPRSENPAVSRVATLAPAPRAVAAIKASNPLIGFAGVVPRHRRYTERAAQRRRPDRRRGFADRREAAALTAHSDTLL
jgi:hypothetical protein